MIKAIAQVEYPITHALKAKPGESFSRTKNLLILTPHMHLSIALAEQFFTNFWAQQWFDQGGNVLMAELKSGQLDVKNFQG